MVNLQEAVEARGKFKIPMPVMPYSCISEVFSIFSFTFSMINGISFSV